eukprot:TRINITY_DN20508_c0_g1_i1.p1 TRINITY_DN20508_c0_g1~~TRINITY_DN20508_c0_g1_i1.p1  ORF type:complete len:428 (+),score=86.13 TRINITY_DN20508_c0_g1_i1:131-1414(+)
MEGNTNNFLPSIPIHVEVCMKSTSTARIKDVEDKVTALINTNHLASRETVVLFLATAGRKMDFSRDDYLKLHVSHITVCELELPTPPTNAHYSVQVHVYQLNEDGSATEMQEGTDTPACHVWDLPSSDFDGLWESLIYEDKIKAQLVSYVTTSMLFSDRSVDSNIISCNRVVLLHGPPGTGKTSLCKALAQKLSIRLSKRYTQGQLIEINAHSLFSKWFSESGKMVLKMFDRIREILEDEDIFVCVLIDEVESLTAARATGGGEPGDAMRVVNAVLTQIDKLRSYKNVIVLATTNITKAVDIAFIDRADLSVFIGPPSISARYTILASCIEELMRAGLITPRQSILDYKSLLLFQPISSDHSKTSQYLLQTAESASGLSGRALRKLPFTAHALFLPGRSSFSVQEFIYALSSSIEKNIKGKSEIMLS